MKRHEPAGPERTVRPDASATRWTDCLPDWGTTRPQRDPWIVGFLHGEGIGPEVVDAALEVLAAVGAETGLRFDVRDGGDVGTPSRTGGGLSENVAEFCHGVFANGGALLCGPVGGRFVYDLRARFDLFCKLVPLRPHPALTDTAIIRPDLLDGVDVLLVRENIAGLYFGEFGRHSGGRVAYQNLSYSAEQVARIIAVAVDLARTRRGHLTVVVKRGGIPEVSALWAEQAAIAARGRDVAIEVLEVDNAGFQLVANPRAFDVVVASNLFGDVLADSATVMLGSRGMSYSANFGPAGRAAYQTGHGAAHDLAGADRANPIAQILSLATMLRESFGLPDAARRIEDAISLVLAAGMRTADVAGSAHQV
ncbi:MAG: isocitrate/isopropylmalate family dehydrogenase, partial [Candidatus Binatia bacterium]